VHQLPKRIAVGVLGASGYAGRELCALIARHPGLALVWATAHDQCGDPLRLRDADGGARTITFVATDDAPLAEAALVCSALPYGTSALWVGRARAAGAKVIDLSTDLRPGQPANRPAGHTCPDVRADAYGLPELDREAIRCADIVANPGCYATAVLLALLPALMRGLIANDQTVSVTAASGVTGAGNASRRDLLFAEVTEDFRAYAVGNTHRHVGEMRAMLDRFGATADLVFTPHLLPVARGIVATVTLPLAEPVPDPLALWREHYAGEPFVEITEDTPALRDVVHRNVARISATIAAGVRRPTLIVTAAIDNLVKGAAGQALQNANLMLGLDECAGLPT
jgi:N-acetyl-gamma-glutamyl-phosphate reductase